MLLTGMASDNKFAGLALALGSVLTLAALVFDPGAVFIDRVNRIDLIGLTNSMAANANLTHLISTLLIVGLLLELYGVAAIWRTIRGGNVVASITRLGIMVVAVSLVCLIIFRGE